MSKRWLRGPSINTPGTSPDPIDHVPFMMFLYHFLTKICGYTHVDEVVTGGPTRTFQNGHEATNTDGILTNSDLTFSSASNPFVIGDVGKFLVIDDPANPENAGIYEIATYVGAGQVTINFYVPGGTYPTANTGLTWWMFDTNNASYTPVTQNDKFVIRSPHGTYPFEMMFEAEDLPTNYHGAKCEASPNSGAWDAVGHAWQAAGTPSYSRVLTRFFVRDRYHSTAPQSRTYIMADTDGSFILFWNDRSAASFVQATMVAVVDPLESTPARSANERLLVAGATDYTGQDTEVDRGDDAGGLGYGKVWEDYGNTQRVVRLWALVAEGTSTDYFSRNIGVNARTGERDALPFMFSISPESADHRFAPHSKVPVGHISMGTAVAVGELTSFDSDSYFHLRDGIVVPWNGLQQA